MMVVESPSLYPTPLLGGFGDTVPTNVPPDEKFSGSLTMFPTPLLGGFARQADRSFYGALGMHPTPLLAGFQRKADRSFSGAMGLHPTPLVSGFVSAPSTRDTSYTEQDGYGTPNGSTTVWVDQKTHTVSGATLANKTWMIIAFCAGNMEHSALDMAARFRNNTGSIDIGVFEGAPGDLSINTPLSFMGVFSFGASPGDQTFSIGAKSVQGLNAKTAVNRIMLIELTSDDAYVYDTSDLSVAASNSVWTTMGAVNVPVDGDYDMFAFSCYREPSTNGTSFDFELLDSAGARDKYVLAPGTLSTTRRIPMLFHSQRLGMTAGQSATLRAKDNSGPGSSKVLFNRCVVALNRRRWRGVGYSNDPTTRSGATGTYAERNPASTLAVTFDGTSEYIAFGNATQYLQTGGRLPNLRLIEGSTVIGEGAKVGGNMAGGDRPWVAFKKYTPAAGASSISWQFKETSSGGTPDYKFADVGYWKV